MLFNGRVTRQNNIFYFSAVNATKTEMAFLNQKAA
jgi:hypothetical protein